MQPFLNLERRGHILLVTMNRPETRNALSDDGVIEEFVACWARLLKRVFDIDMQHCPNCGAGELKIIAAILERPVIEKILTHLGLDPQPPPRGRAREARQD